MISSENNSLQNSNNFYHKNQSNIFNYGPQVEKAIHVAKNQPLPPNQSINASAVNTPQTIEEIVDNKPKDVPYLSHHNQAFTISGGFNEDIAVKRESERKKWIEELNAQIKEKQSRKSGEKIRQPFNENEMSRNKTFSNRNAEDRNHETSAVSEPISPNSFSQGSKTNFDSDRNPLQNSYVRGQNAYIDPVELERRQEVRRKALEQQNFIKSQIEERRKEKQEEERQRKLEEESEMKRIEEEKRRIQKDLEKEAERTKVKEKLLKEELEKQKKSVESSSKPALDSKRQKHPRPKREIKTSDAAIEFKRNVTEVLSPKMEAVPEDGISSQTQKPSAKVYASVSTQTMAEVSCQTDFGGNLGYLPSETRLIQIPDRELSVIQVEAERSKKERKPQKGSKSEPNLPKRKDVHVPLKKSVSNAEYDTNGRKKNAKVETGKPPKKSKPEYQLYDINGKRIKRNQPEPKKNTVQYDSNGRRIRPKNNENSKENFFNVSTKYSKNENVSLVVLKENQPLSDILDNPKPEKSEQVNDVFILPEEQIQMRYTSPKNESVSIPSPISVRQNDILQQLEKLRLGLKDRRKVYMSRNLELD